MRMRVDGRCRLFCVVFVAFALAGAAVGQPYKWTDKDGKVHYGDHPPRDAKLEEIKGRIQSFGGPAQVESIVAAGAGTPGGDAVPPRAGITLYGTTWCGYCKQARAYLSKRGIAYRDLDIEADATAHREYKALGGSGVPLIVVGANKMQGWGAERMEWMLAQARR